MPRLELRVFDRHGAGGQGVNLHAFRIGANLLRMKQISRSKGQQARDQQTRDQAVIETSETAALMFQPKSLELLSVLIESERSLQQISDVLGWAINTSKYQLERLCQAGLVTCTREEARAGRPIRFYRAIASQFFVPYVLTPAMNPATLLEQEYVPKSKRFAHNLTMTALKAREAQGEIDWGVRFSLENGKIRQHAALEEAAQWNFLSDDDPALIDVWEEGLMLSREDAKALQLELCHLFARYCAKAGEKVYTLRLGLTPEVG
jgi:predicted transcriptional regulator